MLYFGRMKVYLFLLLFLLFSCEQKVKDETVQKVNKPSVETSTSVAEKNRLESQPWFQYYQAQNPELKIDFFSLEETSPISYEKTNVKILNQKGFNEIYKPFLIFNESKDKYLDLDSYHWFLGADGSASFEADQQVVLVDLKNKNAKQIAFFGPSFWIEDAYWKGDSIAVLLGNTYEKVPFFMEYNFENNTKKYYKYSDTLKFETSYSKVRLKNKGINTD